MVNISKITEITNNKIIKYGDLQKFIHTRNIKRKLEKYKKFNTILTNSPYQKNSLKNKMRMNIIRNLKNKYSLNTPPDIEHLINILTKLNK